MEPISAARLGAGWLPEFDVPGLIYTAQYDVKAQKANIAHAGRRHPRGTLNYGLRVSTLRRMLECPQRLANFPQSSPEASLIALDALRHSTSSR